MSVLSIYEVEVREVPDSPVEDRPDLVWLRVAAADPSAAGAHGLRIAGGIMAMNTRPVPPLVVKRASDEGTLPGVVRLLKDGDIIEVHVNFGLVVPDEAEAQLPA